MNAQRQISENHEHLGLQATNIENVKQSSSESNEFQSDLTNNSKGNTGKLPMPKPVLSSRPTPPTPPTPSPSPSPGNNASSIVQASATAGVSSLSFHKRKPKPHGKHHRPGITTHFRTTSNSRQPGQSVQAQINQKVNL